MMDAVSLYDTYKSAQNGSRLSVGSAGWECRYLT